MNPSYVSKFLIDTGAAVSLLRRSEAHNIGINDFDLAGCPTLIGIGNSTVQTIGSCQIDLLVGGEKFCSKFHVVNDLFVPGLFGKNLVRKHQVQIFLANDCIRFPLSTEPQMDSASASRGKYIGTQSPMFVSSSKLVSSASVPQENGWTENSLNKFSLSEEQLDCDPRDLKGTLLVGEKRVQVLCRMHGD